ncbi:MAG: BrnT family toxin [Cyanobacteria bacterium J06581_3]
MRWTWDDEKNRKNKRNHGLSFESAQYVFADPLAISRPDPYPDEERWQTIGLIGSMVVFVVHTYPEVDSETAFAQEKGRIISARQATPHERRSYEEDTF